MGAEVRQLVSIVKDPNQDVTKRSEAAMRLGQLRARSAVSHLVGLLPGNYDRLTLYVVAALGEIGDPAALERLHVMDSDESVIMPGQISAALRAAIKKIESPQRS